MIIEILSHTLMITSFVFIMMLLIEYINVQTHGKWKDSLQKSPWRQYLFASFLGATPGCLGAFSVVSLYSHRVVSIGALVAAMIATSGDEAYVMFSMFPLEAGLLTLAIFLIGIGAGYLTDLFFKKQSIILPDTFHDLELHIEEQCDCYQIDRIIEQLKNISFARALLMAMLILFIIGLFTGTLDFEAGWVNITFILGSLFALFVVTTVPDHFLEEHLWEHVLKKHLLRIFLWTLGALSVIHVLEHYMDLNTWIEANMMTLLFVAVFIGIIPESGPHLVFVSLYATGAIPFSILLASSIVQDGHGMLPLLAVSKKSFIQVKMINVAVGLLFGYIGLIFF